MILCPSCNNTFSCLTLFGNHYKLVHSFSTELRCKQTECFRTFRSLLSFKKHISLKHITDLEKDTHSRLTVNPEPNTETTSNFLPPHNPENVNCSVNQRTSSFKECLVKSSITFICKLYTNHSLSRAVVENILLNFCEMLSGPVELLRQEPNLENINDMLLLLKNPFYELHSEYKRIKYFENNEYFIPPEQIVVGQRKEDKRINGVTSLTFENCYICYVSIARTLKLILEVEGVYKSICNYLSSLDDEITSNIIQSSLWKDIRTKFVDKTVLPLLLYFDDFEVGNPIGSHAGTHKIGAVYFTIACLPPEVSSHLENIFVAQLHFANDHKLLGNSAIFNKIIRDLQDLENNGITINVNSENVQIYFAVVLVLGDNLGLNTILGFAESFSSNFFCRFCLCDKVTSQSQVVEAEHLLRNSQNYNRDAQNYANGVREYCIWNSLCNYEVTRNLSCDIMHDIYEGVCKYEVASILYQFIYIDKYFTLDILNNRVRFFNFNVHENKPSSILKSHLFKRSLKFSAAEMKNFNKYLPCFIGDLIPQTNNVFWEIYLILYEIIDIIESNNITRHYADYLNVLIQEHHTLYVAHIGTLKPKHHFLVHYSRIMSLVGPLKNISSIRFEAKHRQLKTAANAISSRRNIAYSLILRNQLSLCHRILARKPLHSTYEFGTECTKLDSEVHQRLCNFTGEANIAEKSYIVSWVKINGLYYSPNSFLLLDYIDFLPIFCKITSIVSVEDKNIYFICVRYETKHYELHLHAYEICEAKETCIIPYCGLSNVKLYFPFQCMNKIFIIF